MKIEDCKSRFNYLKFTIYNLQFAVRPRRVKVDRRPDGHRGAPLMCHCGFTPLESLVKNPLQAVCLRGKFLTGFTLLEVVIAIAILAVGLLMLLSLQNQTIELSSYSKNLSLAMLIAKEKMVELEMRERELTEIELRDGRMEERYPAFRVEEMEEEETVLSFLDFGEDIQLMQIGVRVSWDEGKREGEYMLTTWIALFD